MTGRFHPPKLPAGIVEPPPKFGTLDPKPSLPKPEIDPDAGRYCIVRGRPLITKGL